MKLRLLTCLLISVFSGASVAVVIEPPPIILHVASPSYYVLDGRWYVYEAPFGLPPNTPLRIFAQPVRGGFFAHGFMSGRNCTRAGGGAVSTSHTLTHGESVLGAVAGAIPLARTTSQSWLMARVGLISCPGNVVVVKLTSAHGDLVCSNSIPRPFGPSVCPATGDASGIFQDGFGTP